MQNNYTYQGALEASERIGWRVEDIIGGEKRLDFTKPFMPESLAQVKQLSFLIPDEQRTLNQIRAMNTWPCLDWSKSSSFPTWWTMRGCNSRETTTASARYSSLPARRRSTFTFSSASGRNSMQVSAVSVTLSAPQRM